MEEKLGPLGAMTPRWEPAGPPRNEQPQPSARKQAGRPVPTQPGVPPGPRGGPSRKRTLEQMETGEAGQCPSNGLQNQLPLSFKPHGPLSWVLLVCLLCFPANRYLRKAGNLCKHNEKQHFLHTSQLWQVSLQVGYRLKEAHVSAHALTLAVTQERSLRE